MPSSVTSYCRDWEASYPFLQPGSTKHTAKCTYCVKEFKISSAGIGQVRSHANGERHKEREKIICGKAKQRRIVLSVNSENPISLSGDMVLTAEDSVLKAEVLQALKVVESNYSFASSNGDGDRFRLMFPDSKIAENYKQNETKVRYVIQYGIAPSILQNQINELKDTPFVFKFDETTTSQVKKQYDAYVQLWSRKDSSVVSMYCGSLFVGHCTSEQLVEHFYEIGRQMEWSADYMLHLGMDGPRVNSRFQKLLLEQMSQKYGTEFLNIGSCSLHQVHNAFRKGVQAFDFDIDGFVLDSSFFFKLSACRREDYLAMEVVTDLAARFALRHVTSRWLSLRKACLRLLEQWSNLQEYFLNFLPTQKNFKREIENTSRYQRISTTLKDPLSQVQICFLAFAANDFEAYLVKLQRDEPMIHTVYMSMTTLLQTIMSKFMKKDAITSSDKITLLDGEKLAEIDVSNKETHVKLSKIDIGTRAKSLLISHEIPQEKQTAFRRSCLKLFTKSTEYLQENLPLKNTILKDAQYLHPQKQQETQSLPAISRLTVATVRCLKNHLQKVYSIDASATSEDICDMVRQQWRQYQMESIAKDWLVISNDHDKPPVNSQTSYWKDVERSWADLVPIENAGEFVRIDHYWSRVFRIEDENGKQKYPQLEALVKCILTLSHGNAGPEKGFSINKAILQSHGSSLSEDTLIALRRVKDSLLRVGGLNNFTINRSLLSSVRQSKQRYKDDLELKRKISKDEHEKRKENEKNAAQKSLISQIDAEILQKEKGIEVAEETVIDGNRKLQELLMKKPLNQKAVQCASSQIEMGLTRKRQLTDELDNLKKRKVVIKH